VSDIIQLLPDSVANQIAAGEVIQRPASVVKELVENSLDAGADEITIHIKDAGKTLIKIADNGCGMSPTDARMAFERHATSKIIAANDLFCINTLGFRGEALPSVAAIADVEIQTKRNEDEIGTYIHISGSELKTQEPAGCINGTVITVKNLFFNVPARRKFLKSNNAELRHIINEFQRVSLPNSEIHFSLYHNNSLLYDLKKSNYRRRIVDVFGKNINQSLVPVDEKTSLVNITGYTGQPKFAKKTIGEQFFFVNKRYMRNPYFHKAVMQAYEKLLPSDTFPSYFLFLDIDPAGIDINVHPTKTEIKFENDKAIWQIIHAAVRESLGRHNVVPSIDFDQSGKIEIPVPDKNNENISFPEINIDPEYNPFDRDKQVSPGSSFGFAGKKDVSNWEQLYAGLEEENSHSDQRQIEFGREKLSGSHTPEKYPGKKVLQFKQRFILIPVKSGLMIIDQKRAHERIFFEKFMEILKSDSVASQQHLFPQTIELDPGDAELLKNILDDLISLGFDIREFGKNTFVISGTPGVLHVTSPEMVVEKLLEEYKNSPAKAKDKVKEQVAASLAKSSALNFRTDLEQEEIDYLIDNLFACSTPNYSPEGKRVLTILPLKEIEKMLNK